METQVVQQDCLVFTRFCDASLADFHSFASGKYYVHGTDLFKFLQDSSRFVAQTGVLTQPRQRIPQHISPNADQYLGQYTFFFLVADRSDRQLTLVDLERSFCFRQLNVRIPEFFVASIIDVGSQ